MTKKDKVCTPYQSMYNIVSMSCNVLFYHIPQSVLQAKEAICSLLVTCRTAVDSRHPWFDRFSPLLVELFQTATSIKAPDLSSERLLVHVYFNYIVYRCYVRSNPLIKSIVTVQPTYIYLYIPVSMWGACRRNILQTSAMRPSTITNVLITSTCLCVFLFWTVYLVYACTCTGIQYIEYLQMFDLHVLHTNHIWNWVALQGVAVHVPTRKHTNGGHELGYVAKDPVSFAATLNTILLKPLSMYRGSQNNVDNFDTFKHFILINIQLSTIFSNLGQNENSFKTAVESLSLQRVGLGNGGSVCLRASQLL